MTCETVKERLIEYLSGTLDEATRQKIDRHLSTCILCRAEAAEFRVTLDLLHRGLASKKGQSLKLDAAHRHQVLQTGPGRQRRSKLTSVWWVKWQPLLNAAAAVILLLTMAILFMPASSSSRHAARKSMGAPAAAPQVEVSMMDLSAALDPFGKQDQVDRKDALVVGGKSDAVSETVNGEFGQPAPAPTISSSMAVPAEQMVATGEAGSSEGKGFGSGDPRLAAGFEVAMAKSPLVMRGLYAGRTSGGRKNSLNTVGGERNFDTYDQPSDDSIVKSSPIPDSSNGRDGGLAVRRAYASASLEKAKAVKEGAISSKGEEVNWSGPKSSCDERMQSLDGDASGEQTMACEAMQRAEPAPVYNQEVVAASNPFSTFAIDVDTASFTRARKFLLDGALPPATGVRVEEFINAFEYAYPSPDRRAFSVYTDHVRSPFRSHLELLRVGVRGKVIGRDRQRTSVLTLVIDTSGSMNTPDRLDLIKASLRLLLANMAPADRISIVTFGSEARLLLDDVALSQQKTILDMLNSIQATGSTQLEGGLKLGYETAVRHFRSGSVNRVLLLSDGVANLGAGTAGEILSQVAAARQQGVYCSVFGFGQGPYNDVMLETLADKGDGVYRFVDSLAEARQVFVNDLAATLHVIARDVKIQVEFNAARVKTYRQIGYENRALTKEQFRDDKVDAGEVGSGQSVTALYEMALQGNPSDSLGTVRLRWKDAESGQVEELAHTIRASDRYDHFDQAPVRFRLAAGVAEFADHLRNNPLVMGTELAEVGRVIRAVGLELNLDQRVADLVRMVSTAEKLMK